jgi:hypothetical protein
MRLLAFSAAVFALLMEGSAAVAADPAPRVIVRGTIAGIDAKAVSITVADGTTVTSPLAPATSFSTVEPRRFEQIKPTDFVGVTSVPGPNGVLMAQEIHLLPKGFGEGSYAWDHAPAVPKPDAGANMTNGTVAVVHKDSSPAYTMTNASVTASSPLSLKLSYQGSSVVGGKCVGHALVPGGTPCTGVAAIDVPPWTPVVAVVPAKASEVHAGLAVFAITSRDAQGKPVVVSLIVEKNGVKPLF